MTIFWKDVAIYPIFYLLTFEINMAKKKSAQIKLNHPKDPFVSLYRTSKKNKPKPKLAHLQNGEVTENNPSPKFGEERGTVLKMEKSNGVEIRYEQAICSCNGDNERCVRCDGTGYYAKKIIEESDKNSQKFHIKNKTHFRNPSSTQETTFSNDFRGGNHGIREHGKFDSTPLHDDFD